MFSSHALVLKINIWANIQSACLLVACEAKVCGDSVELGGRGGEEPPKPKITSLHTLCQWRARFKAGIGNLQTLFIRIMGLIAVLPSIMLSEHLYVYLSGNPS